MMKEVYTFRVPEERAVECLPDYLGDRQWLVRIVKLGPGDPLFAEIGRIERWFRERGSVFFTSWDVKRSYSREEIEAASLLRLIIERTFEPAGEECGTLYDEEAACPLCGAGARQLTALTLCRGSLPRKRDFAKTIAGEVVVSKGFRRLVEEAGFSGAAFGDLYIASKASTEMCSLFHQLRGSHTYAVVDTKTRVGVNPFVEAGGESGACDHRDLLGLNLISELWIKEATVGDEDLLTTSQYFGDRRGLLRPERELLVSRRLGTAIRESGLKGCRFEVVHLAS